MTELGEVAEAYRRHLPPGETAAFRIDAVDRLGLPVVIAPHRTPDGLLFDGFGYGATEDEALVGALGEISEQVHCERWLATCERVRGSYAALVREHGEACVADPLTLCLPAGSPYTPAAELTWVWGERLGSSERVLLPLEFVAVHRGQMRGVPPLVTPITNGLGAGLCREQALAHGLLELLQRDGNTVSFRALDQGTVIDTTSGLDADTAGLLARLRAAGLRVTVKLAAADFGTVDVYVVGDDDREPWFPMQLTACGEAAHPDRTRAVRKAVLEFAAARSRKAFMHGPLDRVREVTPPGYLDNYLRTVDLAGEEPRCLAAMTDWVGRSAGELRAMLADTVFAERRRVPLSDLPTAPPASVAGPRDRYAHVLTNLIEGGCDVYAVDFSPPGGGVFVTKVVVAGLECETMSYYRLGERGVRRLLDRGDRWVGVGEPPAGAKRVPLTADAEGRLGGPAWLDPAAVAALVGPLYPLYREPNSHTAQLNLAGGSSPSPPQRGSGGKVISHESVMRVCFLSRRYFPAISGMSVYARNLLGELVAAGHDVTLISEYRADPAGAGVYGGGPPPAVPGVRVVGLESVGEREVCAGRPADFEADIGRIVAAVEADHARHRFDLLHAQYGYPTGLAALEAGRRLKLPVVVSIQGGDGHWVGPCCRTHRDAMRAVLLYADAVLVGSRSFAAEVEHNHGVPAGRFTVVPGGTDTGRFTPADERRVGELSDPPTLLFHGRVDARKGLMELLDSFAALARTRPLGLVVSGIGPDVQAAEARAVALGVAGRVRFTGYSAYADAPRAYRQGDLFVSPTYSEGFSNTILEAMASGLPIVSTRTVGVVDCLEHERDALLVEPRDVAGLAAAIARLLDDAPLRRRLACRALADVRRLYSWQAVARQIMAVYDQVAGRTPSAAWLDLYDPRTVTVATADPGCRFRAAPHLL